MGSPGSPPPSFLVLEKGLGPSDLAQSTAFDAVRFLARVYFPQASGLEPRPPQPRPLLAPLPGGQVHSGCSSSSGCLKATQGDSRTSKIRSSPGVTRRCRSPVPGMQAWESRGKSGGFRGVRGTGQGESAHRFHHQPCSFVRVAFEHRHASSRTCVTSRHHKGNLGSFSGVSLVAISHKMIPKLLTVGILLVGGSVKQLQQRGTGGREALLGPGAESLQQEGGAPPLGPCRSAYRHLPSSFTNSPYALLPPAPTIAAAAGRLPDVLSRLSEDRGAAVCRYHRASSRLSGCRESRSRILTLSP
ncbi:hypothetical protein NDU88_006279 [Pleurodeles waltl]|uniref:Uncharacterized protein n=1 Tax=Pleurodeles waltl TaxID=8319 RepID=A0AAV7VQY3_PLEWA|nr:hypothetical protein NDU88_006279 [Pleurodeles waltl]